MGTLIGAGTESYSNKLRELCGENCQYLPCALAPDAIKAAFQRAKEQIEIRIEQTIKKVTQVNLSRSETVNLQRICAATDQSSNTGSSFQQNPTTNSQETSARSRGKVARGRGAGYRGAGKSRNCGDGRNQTNASTTRGSRGGNAARGRGAGSRGAGKSKNCGDGRNQTNASTT